MNADLYLSFLLIAVVFIIIPGPNVWLIISTSISCGRKQGIQTVLGTTCAMAIQLLIAVLASSWLVNLLAESFVWVKWLGVLYLAFIGFQQIKSALQTKNSISEKPEAKGCFNSGFIVSLTNPKTILFFAAFLPQFVDPSLPVTFQLTVLSLSFITLALLFDSLYVLFAAGLHEVIANRLNPRRVKLISGSFLIGLSGIIANSRQS